MLRLLPAPETMPERVATPPLEPSLDPDCLEFDYFLNSLDPAFAESILTHGDISNSDANFSSMTNTHLASVTRHIGTLNTNNDALFTSVALGVNHPDTDHPINTGVNTFGDALLTNATPGVQSTVLDTPAANVDATTMPGSDAFPASTTTQTISTNAFEPPVADTSPATVLHTNTENTLRRSGRAVVPTEEVARFNKANKPNAEAGKENKTGSDQKGAVKRGGRGGAGTRPSKRACSKG
jgi:hypothetical protein